MTTKNYKTSNLLTAVTMLSQKHTLLTTDASNPKRVVFVFADSQSLQEDIALLNRGELRVDPNDLWAAERRCKELIYGGARI